MRLIPIEHGSEHAVDLQTAIDLGSEATRQVVEATLDLYARKGRERPWLSYLAIKGVRCDGTCDMMELDCSKFSDAGSPPHSPPVCFDVTHSPQLSDSRARTGGRPDRALQLAKAATALGVHSLFVECHPNPKEAWSDGATQLGFKQFEEIVSSAAKIWSVSASFEASAGS